MCTYDGLTLLYCFRNHTLVSRGPLLTEGVVVAVGGGSSKLFGIQCTHDGAVHCASVLACALTAVVRFFAKTKRRDSAREFVVYRAPV